MLTFIIPVKSERVSGSWDRFSNLFERTLKSVCNQTSQNFRIIVVCHEKPKTDFQHPNLEYIHVGFDPPKLDPNTPEKHDGQKEEDKSNKILMGVGHSKQYNPDYLMVVDADDCISNKIVDFVESNKNKNTDGWYFNKGYIYREGDGFISLNQLNFNTLCGTCIIIKPDRIKEILQQVPHLLYVHKTTHLKNGGVLEKYPYPGAIYSLANGENHYMSGQKAKSLAAGRSFGISTLKSVYRKFKKYRIKLLSSTIKNEFGIYKLDM